MKRLLPLILFFLIIAGAVFFLRDKVQVSGPTVETTIIITDKEFLPNSIIVELGTTVIWKNEGNNLHWPASNFHPTHSLYPEEGGCISSKFDACRGLKTGETFSFKFEKIGKWPVHDHLFPGLTMIVEVVEKGSLPQNNQSSVIESKLKLNLETFRTILYDEQVKIIKSVSKENPQNAWNFLKQVFIVDGQVVGNAHELGHLVGNEAYDKLGFEGVKICDESFAYACYHGVTEKMLITEGSEAIKKIENSCLRMFPPQKTQNYTGCIHGAGHGLYGWSGADVNKALLLCDTFEKTLRPYCYDGVFMENASFGKTAIDEKDPWKFCTNFHQKYQINCARYQVQQFFRIFGKNLDLINKNCSKALDPELKTICLDGLGYNVAQTTQGDYDEIVSLCQKIKDKMGVERCFMGAARETVFQQYSDWDRVSLRICQMLSTKEKQECLESNTNELNKKP